MIELIVFLGNPGEAYETTRHNAARLFADSLPFADRICWRQKFNGAYAAVERLDFEQWVREYRTVLGHEASFPVPAGASSKFHFLKPDTFMNNSGESIAALARFYKIPAERIMIVHDELELSPGFISLKRAGGLGGHNGLRSARDRLGTADFWRLRFGIGRPNHKDVAGYVLSPFTQAERLVLRPVFAAGAELLAEVLRAAEPDRLLPLWGKRNIAAASTTAKSSHA